MINAELILLRLKENSQDAMKRKIITISYASMVMLIESSSLYNRAII